ncbi:TIGR04086 family membrane protein, partial [Bartonella sp. A05]|uniref:TIGR04086 family membrane protein n=1 Tax=Bartonella sp. A05 TaxID=2967261 RepID=UPI0022A8D5A3
METRFPTDTPLHTQFLEETALETQYPIVQSTISWSAVFAGMLTALAISICFSLLIAALGFGQIDLYSSAPFGGAFLSMGIGSILIAFLSLAAGGFVAGRFSEGAGSIHGFLTWALLMILMTIQTTLFVSGAAHIGAQTVSGVASTLGTEGPTLLSTADRAHLDSLLRDKNSSGVDFNKLRRDLQIVLNKSEIPALNPEHLNRVYKEALHDIRAAITAVREDPSHYRTYLKNLGQNLSNRVQAITDQIDRDDIIHGLMNNGLTRAEAEATADNAIHLYQTASAKTEQMLKALDQKANTIAERLEKSAENVQATANKALRTASSIGWWSFFGCLMG